MRNLEKCPECLQRFHVEWQGKSSRKEISLILNRLINNITDGRYNITLKNTS
jgi:hypothetical protein